jgi:formate hydrogenlyase subunit 6/NADH:ubiquinone oxidoreductase subunit I
MAKKDLFDKLISFYEIMIGKIGNREQFKETLKQTVNEENLKTYFLLPFSGNIPRESFEKKAKRAGIPMDQYQASIERLALEGFIYSYEDPEKGRVYERNYSAFMAEHQVRKKKGTALGKAYADFWYDISENPSERLPTKTPYYRVLPVEAAIRQPVEKVAITVNEVIPDPRAVLPIDVVSEMIKKQPLIALAECYCRLASSMRGNGDNHITECCFMFGRAAQALIETGVARRIDYDEAIHVLRQCEAEGLVHNVDNCEGEITSMCNCCSCCCPVIKTLQMGKKNIAATSRFLVAYNEDKCIQDGACAAICPTYAITSNGRTEIDYEKCIGCGLCVTTCPENALGMVAREKSPRIMKTKKQLWGKIQNEALLGMVTNKIRGK